MFLIGVFERCLFGVFSSVYVEGVSFKGLIFQLILKEEGTITGNLKIYIICDIPKRVTFS